MQSTLGPAHRGLHRPRLRWVVLVVLLAAVALVWAFGGLRGGATVHHEQVGHPFQLGDHATVTVREATAHPEYGGGWTVDVMAICAVTGDHAPDLTGLGDELFGIATTTTPRLVADRGSVELDPQPLWVMGRDHLAPGLQPMPCSFQGHLPDTFRPSAGIMVAFSDLAYGDNSVMGDQADTWYASGDTHRLTLPVRVLPQA